MPALARALPAPYHRAIRDKEEDDESEEEEESEEDEDMLELETYPLYLPTFNGILVQKMIKRVLQFQEESAEAEVEGNFDLVLSLLCGFSAEYGGEDDHVACTHLVMEKLFFQLSEADTFEDKIEVFEMLAKTIGCCKNHVLSTHFEDIFGKIEQTQRDAKIWEKSGTKKQQRSKHKIYLRLRSGLTSALVNLFARCGSQIVYKVQHFFKETGPLFSDPLLYCEFIRSVYQSLKERNIPEIWSLLDVHLPVITTQILRQLEASGPSKKLKGEMLSGISMLVCSCPDMMSPYLPQIYTTFLGILQKQVETQQQPENTQNEGTLPQQEGGDLGHGVVSGLVTALKKIVEATKTNPNTGTQLDHILHSLLSILDTYSQKRSRFLKTSAPLPKGPPPLATHLDLDTAALFDRAVATPLPEDPWDVDEMPEYQMVDVVPKMVSLSLETLEFLFNDIYIEGQPPPNMEIITKTGKILLNSFQEEIFFEHDVELLLLRVDLLITMVKMMKRYHMKVESLIDVALSCLSLLNHPTLKMEIFQKKEILHGLKS